jgi:hypothetical protein
MDAKFGYLKDRPTSINYFRSFFRLNLNPSVKGLISPLQGGKGTVLIIFHKPLQPPLAKGRIFAPITEGLKTNKNSDWLIVRAS